MEVDQTEDQEQIDQSLSSVDDEEDVSRETPATPQARIVKMPNSMKDPMVKGKQFSFEGWVYQCYDERSRGRKFITRIGKIEIIEPPKAESGGEVVPDV